MKKRAQPDFLFLPTGSQVVTPESQLLSPFLEMVELSGGTSFLTKGPEDEKKSNKRKYSNHLPLLSGKLVCKILHMAESLIIYC